MKVLEIENLYKNIGKKTILKDISFNIEEGEIVGFIGPNGSGKTTTMRTITNLIFQDSGEILICGYDILKQREKALDNISAIIENPGLYEDLSGKDNLEIIRKLNKISKNKMYDMIEFVGLKERINDKVKRYSLGMKQRLGLAICLLKEPKLIILDEPTNGLDPDGVFELRKILTRLSEDKNVSILISSHILTEIEKICDRFLYIKEGKIIDERTYEGNNNIKAIKMKVENYKFIKTLLENTTLIERHTFKENELLIYLNMDNFSELLTLFAQNNIRYKNLEVLNTELEVRYTEIYGGNKND